MNFNLVKTIQNNELECEIIERKGIGHPDTLTDALAEGLSAAYASYTLKNHGVILHHNFDKLHILGGATELDFGGGELVRPIRLMMNGRASASYAGEAIAVQEILKNTAMQFFVDRFGSLIDPEKDLQFNWFISTASSPGRTKRTTGSRAHMFAPRAKSEVKGYDGSLLNNDTSMGCGYAPYSVLESAVLSLEKELNSLETKKVFPWLGTDIKIMAVRNNSKVDITLCLPQIAKYVISEAMYKTNLKQVEEFINNKLVQFLHGYTFTFRYNTRDDYVKGDFYLTVTGSSLESGDEGVVGRGNRINGLITPFRPMNLEGACGKNPLYHTGKLYNIVSQNIAKKISDNTGIYCEVFMVGQSGQLLLDPWTVIVRTSDTALTTKQAMDFAKEEIAKIPQITSSLLRNELMLW